MGMISAAFVMVFKQGNPAGWVFGGVSSLLGGVLFPTSSLPDWLQRVSRILPLTHSLEAMRLTVLTGAGLKEVWLPIATLACFTAVLLPAGVFAFSLAVRRAKRTGSLIQY
jgi:ABC-2 type transport system permease protein